MLRERREMPDILHRVGAIAPIEKVYEAIATPHGVGAWWTKETTGGDQVGESITTAFTNPDTGEHVGTFHLTIEEMVPGKRVAWRVADGPAEWVDTLISFDLKQEDDYTVVNFAHQGWREPVEFMAHCSTKWATFLMSLKSYVETGAGEPAPADVQISNWH
jgi:uncharacterized protein YndB with AHSA1/START domain